MRGEPSFQQSGEWGCCPRQEFGGEEVGGHPRFVQNVDIPGHWRWPAEILTIERWAAGKEIK